MDKKVTNGINIAKLENDLNNLDVEKDIKHFATEINHEEISSNKKCPRKKSNKKEESKEKNQFLEEIDFFRNTYIDQFIEESLKRADVYAKNFIPDHTKDFKQKVGLIVKKADEEYKSYKQKLESIELKNNELRRNINIVENHKNSLFSQLKEAEESINKINNKYNVFNELKPYYDDLITEFNIDPNTYKPRKRLLSNDIRRRRKEAEAFAEEINKAREKIKQITEIKKKEDLNNRRINEKMSSELKEAEIKNRNLEEDYNQKFAKIKQEISFSYEFKEENFLLRNSLVTLYNLFYDKLCLERDLNKNPKGINLEKDDYTPKTYETNEIVKYIYLMLKNTHEDTTGFLLREIVSYCNMMLRGVQKGPDKIYYEPLSTVKEIEKLITSIEGQNKDLKNKISSYTKVNEDNQKVINKLKTEIIRVEKMIEILNNKMRNYYLKGRKDSFEKNDRKRGRERESNKIYDFKGLINKNKNLEKKIKQIHAKYKTKKDIVSENITTNLKTDYSQGIEELVSHTNKLFFYRNNLNLKPKEVNLYMKAYKRMKKKLKHLKKVEPNKNTYLSLENVVYNIVDTRISNLIGNLKTLGK